MYCGITRGKGEVMWKRFYRKSWHHTSEKFLNGKSRGIKIILLNLVYKTECGVWWEKWAKICFKYLLSQTIVIIVWVMQWSSRFFVFLLTLIWKLASLNLQMFDLLSLFYFRNPGPLLKRSSCCQLCNYDLSYTSSCWLRHEADKKQDIQGRKNMTRIRK